MTPSSSLAEAPVATADPRSLARVRVTNRHLALAGTLLLLVPNILFALQLRPAPAIVMLIGASGLLALLTTGKAARPDGLLARNVGVARLATCLALAIALLVIGGEGHLMFANTDWFLRDAVLADLAKAPFPPTYEVDGQTFFLRAPLGMYMAPALIARATSLGIGHAALLAQNATLLALALYMLATLAGRHALLTVAIFLSFSGLDALGELVAWHKQGQSIASFALPSHIESWTALQYSSVLTQLFWVPNHALPAYWLTLLVLLSAKEEVAFTDLSLAWVACLLWSPFACIGALPFLLYLLVRDAPAIFATRRVWLAAGASLCFAPVALYMHVDASRVPHELLLLRPAFALTIALFLVVEIPHALVCRHVWSSYERDFRPLLVISLFVLVLLPTVRVGLANDLVMRASIPALMILAIAFTKALSVARAERRWGLLSAGSLIVLVGAITPFQELRRAFTFSAYAISDCNVHSAWKSFVPELPTLENYFARPSPDAALLVDLRTRTPLREEKDRACWPDFPFDPHADVSRTSNDALKRQAAEARP